MSGLAWRRRFRLALLCTTLAGPLAFAQYVVKTQDDVKKKTGPVDRTAPLTGSLLPNPSCGPTALAWHGQPVPGGGTLAPQAWGTSASVNASGRIAFYSQVIGSPRNQGIFTAHGSTLTPIAIGCGSYLGSGDPGTGCGDPTPIGGTFSGFMTGTVGTPSINDAGDVLFLADVHGGSAPRGLFLYRGATGIIQRVAAIGDVASGIPLTAVGNGSLNNRGEVVFLAAYEPANEATFIAHWRDGALTKVVAPGDPMPTGGTFGFFAWFGWLPPDGTYIPFGEFPDINDHGAIAFLGLFGASGALFVSRDGVHERYVGFGDPTPAGGSFFSLYAPILNNEGEIAFQGEYLLDPWLVGWFVGRPGQWRHVLSFYDPIDGGQAWGLAVSHNPMQPLDDEGNLLVWVDVKYTETVSVPRVLLGHADGRLETLVKSGDPSPLGGSFGELNPWPSLHGRRCIIDGGIAGAPGVFGAHVQVLKRPMEVTGLRVATDPAPGVRLSWEPQAGAAGGLVHDVMRGPLSGLVPSSPSVCAASNVAGSFVVTPDAECSAPPGDGCWYLVRAQDVCGSGSYGAGESVCSDACDGGLIPGCPVCGDETINGMEECDGAALGGETCARAGYDGGTLGCTPSCLLDTSGCTTICGNGIRRGDEECDVAVQGDHTCLTLGYDGGILGCGGDCRFDVTGCCCSVGTPECPVCPVCGNGVREAPQEICDGADLGGETCMSRGWASGTLACTPDCTWFDFSGCIGHQAADSDSASGNE